MKYILAIFVCFIELAAWSLIGVMVFGWKHGGGVIPMVILLAIVGATWRAITKSTNEEDKNDQN